MKTASLYTFSQSLALSSALVLGKDTGCLRGDVPGLACVRLTLDLGEAGDSAHRTRVTISVVPSLQNASFQWTIVHHLPSQGNLETRDDCFSRAVEAAGPCTCLLTDAILVAFLKDEILVMSVWMPVGGFLGRSWEHAATGDQQMSKCTRCYAPFQLSSRLAL